MRMQVETFCFLTSDILLWPNSSPRKLKRKQLTLVLVSEYLVHCRRKEWEKGLQHSDQEAEEQGDWLKLFVSLLSLFIGSRWAVGAKVSHTLKVDFFASVTSLYKPPRTERPQTRYTLIYWMTLQSSWQQRLTNRGPSRIILEEAILKLIWRKKSV